METEKEQRNPAWRRKSMTFDEWTGFQHQFEQLFISLGGAPDTALFIKGSATDETEDVYITSSNIEQVEALAPGGWQDIATPTAENLSLLVGVSDARQRFGIERAER